MKRVILAVVLAISLGAVVGVSVQVLTTGDSSSGARVVEAAPYPRTTSPLPVPEIVVGQEPWRDPPSSSARQVQPVPRGFATLCSPGSPPPTDPGVCLARPREGAH
jgi:hypothetical protein